MDASTRFEIDVYSPRNNVPIQTNFTDEIYDKFVMDESLGIPGINFSRSKESAAGVLTLSVAGAIPFNVFVGCWVRLRSKAGSNFSQNDQGLVRFIGQIASITNTIQPNESGALLRRTNIEVREWSHILYTPVRVDLTAIQNAIAPSSLNQFQVIENQLGNTGSNLLSNTKLSTEDAARIAIYAFSPFGATNLILAYVGALSQDKENLSGVIGDVTLPNIPASQRKAVLEAARNIAKVAVRMPQIPKQLLDDCGLGPDIQSDNPLGTGAGLALTITGVQTDRANMSDFVNGSSIVSRGTFSSFDALDDVFDDDPAGRPICSNISDQLIRGTYAWDLITKFIDPTFNEAFTDIWYFNSSQGLSSVPAPGTSITVPSSILKGPVVARPVIVTRDKPYALNSFLNKVSRPDMLQTQWTSFDDVPRVFIDDELVMSITTKNTFMSSPNFIRLNYSSNFIPTDFLNATAQQLSTLRLVPEMNRFGGIEYMPTSMYSASSIYSVNTIEQIQQLNQTERTAQKAQSVQVPTVPKSPVDGITRTSAPSSSKLNTSVTQVLNPSPITESSLRWYTDAAIMMYLWNGFAYRWGSGTLVLKDNNLKIMVGCNVQFSIKGNTYCAHVESFSLSHSVMGNGAKVTTSTINFSHLCGVNSDQDETLFLLTPSLLNDLSTVNTVLNAKPGLQVLINNQTDVRISDELDALAAKIDIIKRNNISDAATIIPNPVRK